MYSPSAFFVNLSFFFQPTTIILRGHIQLHLFWSETALVRNLVAIRVVCKAFKVRERSWQIIYGQHNGQDYSSKTPDDRKIWFRQQLALLLLHSFMFLHKYFKMIMVADLPLEVFTKFRKKKVLNFRHRQTKTGFTVSDY